MLRNLVIRCSFYVTLCFKFNLILLYYIKFKKYLKFWKKNILQSKEEDEEEEEIEKEEEKKKKNF